MASDFFTARNFTVEGIGEFPHDMLRWDRCWPKTLVDANRVGPHADHRRRQVNLVTHTRKGQSWPTIDRWRSFGWRVVSTMGEHHG